MTHQTLSPNFRRLAGAAADGMVIKPLLDAYFHDARYPDDLTISFKKHNLEHGPDGWFHPSTHPLWSDRRLFYYLTEPQALIAEPMEPKMKLSVTIGEAMHGFIKTCMADHGLLVTRAEGEFCPCGDPDCDEWFWKDDDAGSCGHGDGVTQVFLPSRPDLSRQNFEFKTRSPKAKVIPDLDLEAFKEKYPGYYAQQQEYMRMSGYLVTILVFMSMGYPWDTTEIHIPYDPKFALGVRDKYLRVREWASEGRIPMACCAPKSAESKKCHWRGICPIALAR